MPPRRQRKRKVHTALSGTEFIEEVNDSFDQDAFDGEVTFKEMFDDLKQMNNLNQNLESYYMEFYERIICGCAGVLVGEKRDPINYSLMCCTEEQLEPFVQATEEFLQRFPIMRNVMDKVLFRFLQRLSSLNEQMRKRLLKVIAMFIKHKLYNRSKKEEFFLCAAMDCEGSDVVAECLDMIKEICGPQFTFDFALQYGLVAEVRKDNFDTRDFEKIAPWFLDYINKVKAQEQLERSTQDVIESLRESEGIQQAVEFAHTLHPEPNAWIQFLITAALKSLEVAKHGLQSCSVQFQQLVPLLKPLIDTVAKQGLVMDVLMRECYNDPSLSEMFKQCLLILYQAEIVDGNVIIAWYERAQGNGKTTFSKQVFRFVEWLKQE